MLKIIIFKEKYIVYMIEFPNVMKTKNGYTNLIKLQRNGNSLT